MRKPQWLLLAALPAVLVLGAAALVFVRTQHSLERATVSVAQEGRFPFELRSVGPQENPGFESVASAATYSSGALYQGKLYISGPSGLLVYGAGEAPGVGARLLKSYRVGWDLPAAPLGQLVVARLRGASEPELIIATDGQGVLLFAGSGHADGSGSFRQLITQDADARNVTALLPLPAGDLLIGTRKRGLLIYRGQAGRGDLEIMQPQLAGFAVTALAGDETGIWIGTRDRGVLHLHAGQMDNFSGALAETSEAKGASDPHPGLPDTQVDAIAVHGDQVFVGTPLGVEEFDHGRPARVLAKNTFANALYADDKDLVIGSMDQGIRRVSLEAMHRPGTLVRSLGDAEDGSAGPAQQFLRGGDGSSLFAVMRDGLREQRNGGLWTPLISDYAAAKQGVATLTDENISALAFAADGRLWVGYFDRGLDILSTGDRAVEHHEDDRLFCVNRIVFDATRKTMAVATANGLELFDERGRPRQLMTRRDGLIADHVTDVAFSAGSMVVATPAGLTFVDANGARSMYAFEGLVNNHIYALGVRPAKGEVLAGTLGGVSEVVHEAVTRNLTVSNSGLKHNWVTAIVPLDGSDAKDAWMVGTYGAGVMLLDGNGHFTAMDGATRDMVVNPNAMLATDAHIFAGTLGNGLWVWSRATGRWRQMTAGLPSENVTALTEHAGQVYVGTENGLVRIAERLLD
jgi:ligand-binding sensor domain-containing protein